MPLPTPVRSQVDGDIPEIEGRPIMPEQVKLLRLDAPDKLIAFVDDADFDPIPLVEGDSGQVDADPHLPALVIVLEAVRADRSKIDHRT
jgi:hypothetical protein